jgi:mannan endo-1,4-beta-mannosidase
MHSFSCWLFALLSFTSVFASPTRTLPRGGDSSPFITAKGDSLYCGDKPFKFVGTNAYWLPFLNSDADINKTFADMASIGITVVRTWAFNDVTEVPDHGFFFQVIANGTTTINTGPNGLQRLDTVLKFAEQYGIKVIFSLTNNWNPIAQKSSASGAPPPLPRNFLSNDYGGMDAYVREFTKTKTHDDFYTDDTVRGFFLNYLSVVVARYVDCPALLGWEIANDARCASSLAASSSCDTQTVTQFHSDIAQFIRSIDCNHLITSGTQGFFCPDCPKLFPITPPPAPSPAPGGDHKHSKYSVRSIMNPTSLFQMITKERRSRASTPRDGVKIRGRWTASSQVKRGGGGVGSSFDGSQGVDSQDILNIPDIDFATFQLFPDQNTYSPTSSKIVPPSADFNGTVAQGVAWIEAQADSAKAVGKPFVCSGFGLVSQGNIGVFIPFNGTTPVGKSSSKYKKRQDPGTVGTGVSDSQVVSAYQSFFQAGFNSGASGMSQYQDSEQNLTPAPGTVVQGTNSQGTVGSSPNDGYGSLGANQGDLQQTIQGASQNFT